MNVNWRFSVRPSAAGLENVHFLIDIMHQNDFQMPKTQKKIRLLRLVGHWFLVWHSCDKFCTFALFTSLCIKPNIYNSCVKTSIPNLDNSCGKTSMPYTELRNVISFTQSKSFKPNFTPWKVRKSRKISHLNWMKLR